MPYSAGFEIFLVASKMASMKKNFKLHEVKESKSTLTPEEISQEILTKKNIRVFFQPIINVKDGTILAMEALSRLPADFPDNLRTPFTVTDPKDHVKLDLICLDKIFSAYLHSSETHHVPPLFINCKLDNLGYILNYDLDSLTRGHITVELDLNYAIYDLEAVLEKVKLLKERSFSLAIDDIGENHFDKSLVEILQPDFIKIDISIVKGISKSKRKEKRLKELVALANNKKIEVIVEGIEVEEDLEVIVKNGCHYVQGFLFARPSQIIPHDDEYEKILSKSVVAGT